jgi:hypothetical protein
MPVDARELPNGQKLVAHADSLFKTLLVFWSLTTIFLLELQSLYSANLLSLFTGFPDIWLRKLTLT